jgi:hypothetical protein
MRLVEFCDEQIIVEGDFLLNAQMDGYQAIHGVLVQRELEFSGV